MIMAISSVVLLINDGVVNVVYGAMYVGIGFGL